jgi:hypothetical protein
MLHYVVPKKLQLNNFFVFWVIGGFQYVYGFVSMQFAALQDALKNPIKVMECVYSEPQFLTKTGLFCTSVDVMSFLEQCSRRGEVHRGICRGH